MREKTHYDLLEVSFGASEREIKKAFRRQAQRYHPDQHPVEKRDEVRKKFEKIKHAYEVLKDPESRALYDRNLVRDSSVRVKREDFWKFWRQFLTEKVPDGENLSYHEKMVMDSFEEDWLEENYGGTARDRQKFRKHLNFGKMQLAQDNVHPAYREFIRADTTCERNILSKFYVGYTLELKSKHEEALKRYRFAVDIGLSRPPRHVNKCFRIRRRIVKLHEKLNQPRKSQREKRRIESLKGMKSGFDKFLYSNQDEAWGQRLRNNARSFFKWLSDLVSSRL